MTQRTGTFESTLTIPNFKKAYNTEDIRVLKNPKTGKFFFTYDTIEGSKKGAVSSIIKNPAKELTAPVISKIVEADGSSMLLLHNAAVGLPTLLTL